MRLALPLRALLLAAYASGLQFAPRAPAVARSREVVMMGRKFENNKLKMAKTALAYAKKASYIGKKVVLSEAFTCKINFLSCITCKFAYM